LLVTQWVQKQSRHTKSKVEILNDNNDGNATLEFVFGSGAVEVGDNFTVCFKDSEDEPFYACRTGVNGHEKSLEHVYS